MLTAVRAALALLMLTLIPAADAAATVYEVGPGRPDSQLADVPWGDLQPGDEVRIHAGVYKEKLWLSESGTPEAPITITGVPGPGGEPVVIDAAGATEATTAARLGGSDWMEDLGAVIIYNTPEHPWGTKPSWITLQDLEIRGAKGANAFTDVHGAERPYLKDSGGV